MGKAFEKQTKTIEDQGKKQIDALVDVKPKEIKPRKAKPNENGNYFLNELARIRKTFEPVNFYDLINNFKDSDISSVSFIEFKVPNTIFENIHNGNIPLEDIEKEQNKLKGELACIKQGDSK